MTTHDRWGWCLLAVYPVYAIFYIAFGGLENAPPLLLSLMAATCSVVGLGLISMSVYRSLAGSWRQSSALYKASRKTCPDCTATVPREARVCRHCAYRFEGSRPR